jgi:CHASE3 domain sensor protein
MPEPAATRFRRFLEPWFARVLDEPEQALLRGLFADLGTADDYFSGEIEQLADWLSQQARTILDLVDEGRIQEANQRIRKAQLETRSQRDAIRAAMDRLSVLQAEFTDAAGVV